VSASDEPLGCFLLALVAAVALTLAAGVLFWRW
jgi:hypothetical protein